MPDFGLYAQPDGPFPNPADLPPRGRIEEARAARMEMAAACKADMLYVARCMAAVGADGIDFDTTASAGDAEIPIHANVGMGVGGVPMFEAPPPDVLTRCSAAMVEIGRVDGL